MTIPDVIKPVPALWLDRRAGNIALASAVNGVVKPRCWVWMEGHVIFWNLDKQASGTVAVFNYN